MIHLDRTFCSGLRCSRRGLCDRWIDHPLVKPVLLKSGRQISYAQFADHDGKCGMFSSFDPPIEKAPGHKPEAPSVSSAEAEDERS